MVIITIIIQLMTHFNSEQNLNNISKDDSVKILLFIDISE